MNDPRRRTAAVAGLEPQQPFNGQRRRIAGPGAGQGFSAFIYDTGRQSGGELGFQVKYGPGLGFDMQQLDVLHAHYTESVTSRYTQYNPDRSVYVSAAQAMGRGLTVQESDVATLRDPGLTSIDHIIASGTGQQALNRSTLNFLGGRGTAMDGNNDLRTRFGGIAAQAASVGRMLGLGREILREESRSVGYGATINHGNLDESQAFVAKRNVMFVDLFDAFENGNEASYKRYMKHTFDSPGNLRLGHSSGNQRVSTGFDMPLDRNLQPTQRGQRLLDAYRTFGFQDMMTNASVGPRNAVGTFTTNLEGQVLSSSRQVSGDTVDHSRRFR